MQFLKRTKTFSNEQNFLIKIADIHINLPFILVVIFLWDWVAIKRFLILYCEPNILSSGTREEEINITFWW